MADNRGYNHDNEENNANEPETGTEPTTGNDNQGFTPTSPTKHSLSENGINQTVRPDGLYENGGEPKKDPMVHFAATNNSQGHVDIAMGGSKQKTNMESPGTEVTPVVGQAQAPQSQEDTVKLIAFCRLIVKWPKASFGIALSVHISMLLITMLLIRAGYDVLPITFDRVPLEIRDDVDYLRGMAWNYRTEDEGLLDRSAVSGVDNVTKRSVPYEFMEFLFEGSNVFTAENLKLIQDVENAFFLQADFQSKFCLLANDGNCTKPGSIIRFFDGTYSNIDPTFNDPTFSNVTGVLYLASTHNLTKARLQYFLGKDAIILPTSAASSITRLNIVLGAPLTGYVNLTDGTDEQEDKMKKFLNEHFRPLGEKYFRDKVGDMDFMYGSTFLISITINRLVVRDLSLAIGSMFFIFLFMCLQTGSFWVTGWAVLSIMTGFCASNLIYRVILDFRYFGTFHILAVFIILGIGADDIFIFFDTWKATAHKSYPSLEHRMSDCYRKAAAAMFYTSLTTAIAFIVSATSPLLGVSSFGVFSGLLVLVNYVSVVLYFPTVVVTYHLAWEKYKVCCCCPRHPVSSTTLDVDPNAQKRKHFIVRFFRGPYFQVVSHKIFRWVIIVVYLGLISFFIYYATQLKINEESIKFLPDHSNVGKYIDRRNKAFTSTGSETMKIYLVWGLKPQDLSICHHTDVKCNGKTVWDDTFNLNSEQAQTALRAFCTKLKNLNSSQIDGLRIRRNIVTQLPEIDCFIEPFADFINVEADSTRKAFINMTLVNVRKYTNGTNLEFPLNKTEVLAIMAANNQVYNVSLGSSFNRYTEVALSYWLYNGFNGINRNLMAYGRFLGEEEISDQTVSVQLPVSSAKYYYGTRLRYAAFVVNTTIKGSTLGYPVGLPIRDSWEDFMKEEMKTMPSTLQGGFQCTDQTWHWLKVQQRLAFSALIGIIIGISLAIPVLIIATMNVITGLMASVTIILITASVVGVIPLAGWKLGVLESLNLVLVVGLAVDYVVHLAEGYSRSPHADRLGRLQDALEEVGISVLSGAMTTLGASVFLFAAQIIFFVQFGVFMFCTIGFSICYSLGLFITVLGIIGPENDFGSLKPLFRKCCKKD